MSSMRYGSSIALAVVVAAGLLYSCGGDDVVQGRPGREGGDGGDEAGASADATAPRDGGDDDSGGSGGDAAGGPTYCRFDSRTFVDAAGELTESITAYGRYFNFKAADNTPWPSNGSDLTTVARYKTGPCVGRGLGTCVFATRTHVVSGADTLESITGYGRYWNFKAADGTAIAGNGSDLTTVPRYMNGPCINRAAGDCRFQTRTFVDTGATLLESITAFGRYWNFEKGSDTPLEGSNGKDLTSVPRYKNGPCSGRSIGMCVFDTRAIAANGDESITAYGRYWNFAKGSDTAREGNAGGDLAAVARYKDICKYKP